MNGDFLEHYFTNNTDLKSELKEIFYTYCTTNFKFISDNGVFSKNRIDYGSKILVETYLKTHNISNIKILDVGCGYGFMGIVLAKILTSYVDMIDINKRAVHLSKINIKENEVSGTAFVSNGYENITTKYNLIFTNPPIRAGKKIVLDILINAKDYLEENGELWFVMRKDQGVKSVMKTLDEFYNIKIEKKSNGFYIISAKIC